MKTRGPVSHVTMLLGVALCLIPGSPYERSSPANTEYGDWYQELRTAAPDPTRGTTVANLVIRQDAGTLTMTRGRVHLFYPVQGRTVGAVFVGEGRFDMTAPTEVEQRQLERLRDSSAVSEPIRTAVLFFSDGAADGLFPGVTWTPEPVPSSAQREIEEALKYVSDNNGWFDRDLLIPWLNDRPGMFYAHVAQSRGDPLIFSVNPYRAEEIALYRRARTRGDEREVVSQFYQASDYAQGTNVPQQSLDLVLVSSYDIEVTIESNIDFSARATMVVGPVSTEHRWVPFRLYHELEVDSMTWDAGQPATFFRPEESEELWVDFSSAPDPSSRLSVFYSGDLLERDRRLWISMKSSSTWYPVYEYWRPASYTLTFHTPEKLRVATVGRKTDEVRDDGTVTTVWQAPVIRQATFNVGDFTEHRVEDERIPNLLVQYDDGAHRSLREAMTNSNLFMLEQRDMASQVGADLANSFAFFNDAFGITMVDDFIATEIPYSHGEAYPGLVLLSWATYQWTSEEGFDEMFRAHEVAHQWWGIGVQPATYHDRWLGEGFSEFAGLWYMGRIRGSAELMMRRLKETREAIVERRDEAAPIWLGTRVGDSRHPEDYQLIVYEKGAWVLHMIRGILQDLNTGDDSRFTEMMKDFYTTHLGGLASTEQFRRMVEKHAGIPMDWFFRQWVYGSGIPRYHFSYKLEEQADGTVKATVRIRQDRVPESFRMLVPLLVDFGAEGTALVRLDVNGPVTELELPILPMKPDRLEFNPMEAVLAETRTEDWQT